MAWNDNKLKKFEGSVLWRIVGSKNEEVIQGCRKEQNLFLPPRETDQLTVVRNITLTLN
jgi:hypothetical protein